MEGVFSIKSDVYSFGVLVLEIVSAKKNSNYYVSGYADDLLSYVSFPSKILNFQTQLISHCLQWVWQNNVQAWKLWKEGRQMEFVDTTLSDSYSNNEVLRCIHIGLSCVQDSIDARPTMSTVVLMLNNYSMTISTPLQPAFFPRSKTYPDFISSTDQSMSKSQPLSVNDVSITEIGPRWWKPNRNVKS